MNHQHIEYKDSLELAEVISELTKLPLIVNVREVKSLQKDLLEAKGCDVTECIGANIEALQRSYVTEVAP